MTLVRWTGFMALAFGLLLLTACTSPETGAGGTSTGGGTETTNAVADAPSDLEGAVSADGSSTVYPISEAIAHGFKTPFPNVRVTIGVSGTGGGFKRFTVGDTDISNASRPIKSGEFEQCKANDVHFVEVPVAYDGLTIVVNKNNTWVEQMTVDELKKIFRAPGVKTWKELNDAYPDEQIKIYAPGTDSGTFDYFQEVIVGKDEGVSIREDMSVSEDDNFLVTGVSKEEYAIGFFGAAYYFENSEELRAVNIVNPKTGEAVGPDPAKIESGEYAPFSRPLFIYVNQKALDRPEIKMFVEYFLDNGADAAKKVGYVALPEELYARAREHVENRITGTHFMTAEGEKSTGSTADLYVEENAVDIH